MLLDTGIIIRHLRNERRAHILLDHLENRGSIRVSVITVMEILVGCRSKKEAESSLFLFERIQPLDVNQDVAEKAALLIRKYPAVFGRGIQRGTPDAIIAATAWNEHRVLLTFNTRQFATIPIPEVSIQTIDQNAPDWTTNLKV